MIRVTLGTREFRSKAAAREFFQAMLHSYSNGQIVAYEDAALLIELLKRHPDGKIKIGCGVDHFEVGGADFASQCFFVHRVDGTYEDFSLHACVDGF